MASLRFPLANTDYGSISLDQQFQPSSLTIQTMCISISLLPDSILENSETFSVHLFSAERRLVLSPSVADVTIINDDSRMEKCLLGGYV